MIAMHGEPLNVGMLGFNERSRSMFELYFSGACRNRYVLVGLEAAQVTIADLDAVDGRKLLDEQMRAFPHRPIVAATVRDLEIDGVQLLHKPIKLDLLQKALEFFHTEDPPSVTDDPGPDRELETEISVEIEVPAIQKKSFQPEKQQMAPSPGRLSAAEGIFPPSPENQTDTKDTLKRMVCPSARYGRSTTRSATRAIEDKSRIAHESCGSMKDISPENIAARELLVYQPKKYIQGHFEDALSFARKENSVVELRLRGAKSLVILPNAGVAITNISDRLLRALTVRPMHRGTDCGIIRLGESEKSLMDEARVELISLEALHWKLAIWTARGRVPEGTDLDQAVRLIHWPNLTRLMVIPAFLRIAAFWSKSHRSLFATASSLSLKQKYVFSFYSACCALNLAHVDLENSMTPSVSFAGSIKRRSIFGRILAHLTGTASSTAGVMRDV